MSSGPWNAKGVARPAVFFGRTRRQLVVAVAVSLALASFVVFCRALSGALNHGQALPVALASVLVFAGSFALLRWQMPLQVALIRRSAAGLAIRARTAERSAPERHEHVVQQLTRAVTRQGEVIRGRLIGSAAAGQRVMMFHVAFCPPLARVPQIELQPSSATGARWKVAQVLCHGMRIEARLTEPADQPETLGVAFVARCTSAPQ